MKEVITVTETNTIVVGGASSSQIQTTETEVTIAVAATGIQGPPGPTGSDNNFVQQFTNETSVTVEHNLNKYPAVTVIDSEGNEVYGDVQYINLNTVQVTFDESLSGSIICN